MKRNKILIKANTAHFLTMADAMVDCCFTLYFLPTPRHQPNPKLLREDSVLLIYRSFLGWTLEVGKKNLTTFKMKVVSKFFTTPNICI